MPQSVLDAVNADRKLPRPDRSLPAAERRRIMNDRLRDLDIKVLGDLLGYRDPTGESCWRSKEAAAQTLGVDERSVQMSWRRLSLAGFIEQQLLTGAGDDPIDPRNRTGWRIWFRFDASAKPLGTGPDRRTPIDRKKTRFEECDTAAVSSPPNPPIALESVEGERIPVSSKQHAGDTASSPSEKREKTLTFSPPPERGERGPGTASVSTAGAADRSESLANLSPEAQDLIRRFESECAAAWTAAVDDRDKAFRQFTAALPQRSPSVQLARMFLRSMDVDAATVGTPEPVPPPSTPTSPNRTTDTDTLIRRLRSPDYRAPEFAAVVAARLAERLDDRHSLRFHTQVCRAVQEETLPLQVVLDAYGKSRSGTAQAPRKVYTAHVRAHWDGRGRAGTRGMQ